MSIKVLIDSASDISKEEAKKIGVEMIPLVVTVNDEDYFDGVNLSTGEFYDMLEKSKVLPKTSQINPFRFEEKFEEMLKDCDEVLCITISSKLSGTYASAKSASEKYEGKVYVIDSVNAAAGERLLLMYALDLINKGLTIKEVVDELESVKSRIDILAVVDTLEYLKKGGRVSATVAFVGELLNIKPIVALVDGKVEMIGKTRGSKKAFAFVNEHIDKNGGIDFNMPHVVLYSGNDITKLEDYIEYSKEKFNSDICRYQLGCTIGAHVGPGAVGIAYFKSIS